MFVLFTSEETYIVEYMFNNLAVSKSLEKAKKFNDFESANTMQKSIFLELNIITSINTFIK